MESELQKGINDKLSFFKKSCCKNITSTVEGNSIDQQAQQNLELQQIYFVTSFMISFNNLFIDTIQTASLYLYKPPIIDKDITILLENFRI